MRKSKPEITHTNVKPQGYFVEVSNTDNGFAFRLCKGKKKSEWTGYTRMASLPAPGGMVVAITDYYLSPEFPDSNEIYLIQQLKN
jgi:hypothetical protein